MMRIAIYGAGSLGTILGAFISRAGEKIELINRNKAHVAALQSKGILTDRGNPSSQRVLSDSQRTAGRYLRSTGHG